MKGKKTEGDGRSDRLFFLFFGGPLPQKMEIFRLGQAEWKDFTGFRA
jgi:hypothetical protein